MSKRILIVDDIDFIIEFEEKVISSLSKELSTKIQVDSANNVKDALSNIEKHHYDAMVIDIICILMLFSKNLFYQHHTSNIYVSSFISNPSG